MKRFTICLVTLLLISSQTKPALAVPVSPNKSTVEAIILDEHTERTEGGQDILVWKLQITKLISDLEFSRLKELGNLETRIKVEEVTQRVYSGSKINAVLTYRGDERGGAYWLLDYSVISEPTARPENVESHHNLNLQSSMNPNQSEYLIPSILGLLILVVTVTTTIILKKRK